MAKLHLTEGDMEKAYEIFQGLFFEGSWLENRQLTEAFQAWAKATWPKYSNGIAAAVETTIRDEEGEGELAAFVNSLPPQLRAQALKGIYDDVQSMEEDAALLKRLKALMASGPKVKKEPDLEDLLSDAETAYEEAEYAEALKVVDSILGGVENVPSGPEDRMAAISRVHELRGWLRWYDEAEMVDLPRAVADLLQAVAWGRAAGNADSPIISLCQVYGDQKAYREAIALAEQTLKEGRCEDENDRFQILRVLAFSQLGCGEVDASTRTYRLLFDEFVEDEDAVEIIREDLPEHAGQHSSLATQLGRAFESKKWSL